MMQVHLDTETCGLNVPGIPSDDPRQPHMASLSAFLDDDKAEISGEMHRLIKPAGYRLEDFPEAFRIHGITTERAMAEGVPLADALDEFMALMERAQFFVAFNVFFDWKIIKIACARCPKGEPYRQKLESLQSICTMENAAGHLIGIGRKRIKLKSAYFDLFKEETQTEQFHGSKMDALASRRIFWELKRRKVELEIKPMARREYDTPAPESTAKARSAEVEL